MNIDVLFFYAFHAGGKTTKGKGIENKEKTGRGIYLESSFYLCVLRYWLKKGTYCELGTHISLLGQFSCNFNSSSKFSKHKFMYN